MGFREELEELLKARGWHKSELWYGTDWCIHGIATRPRGAPGHAGSLIEALAQELEREAGKGEPR